MTDVRLLNLRDLRVGNRLMLPVDVVRIDRRSKWGNPVRIGKTQAWIEADDGTHIPFVHDVTREQAIDGFRFWLFGLLQLDPTWLEPLRGRRLACWCEPLACHGDVIIEVLDTGVEAWEQRERARLAA